jgi:hypothetical protein
MGAGCKPAGFCLRWFESNTLHQAETASQSRAEMDRRPDPKARRRNQTDEYRTMPSTSSSFYHREPQASRSRLGRGRASVSAAGSRSVRLGSRFSAGVAQLVERQPSKLNVASSSLVSRSILFLGFGRPNPKPFAPAGSFLAVGGRPNPKAFALDGSSLAVGASFLGFGRPNPKPIAPAGSFLAVGGRPSPKAFAGVGSGLAVGQADSTVSSSLASGGSARLPVLWGVVCFVGVCFAHLAQLVEHVLGKDEVTSSILVVGSRRLEGVAGVGGGSSSQRAFRFAVAAA